MSKRTILACVMTAVLIGPMGAMANPPARPKPLTAAQFQYLTQLEQQPEHLAVREVQATYTSEENRTQELTKLSDGILTVAFQGGVPATILAILICAAPL